MEIGTSILARPARSDRQADLKKVIPAKMAQGAPTAADIHIIIERVAGPSSWSNSPAQIGTENIMAFIAPKPATARARISCRPSRSRCTSAAPGS